MKQHNLSLMTITVLCLLNLLSIQSTAAADQASTVVLVLDASGSMWGQIDGVAKITIAKQSMGTIIQQLPDDAQVGLILYGHRTKGDCNDVELAVPVGLVDKPALLDAVEGINPKGKTPILRSLRMAVTSLGERGAGGTVVLVSDGEETCDDDPCAAVRELKASGVDFVAHVIGFDVADDQRRQLECIAEAAGGKYFDASNADDLEFAARTATVATNEAPASGDGRVWIDEPAQVAPSGTLVVHFEAAPTFHANAWLGIVPADVEHGSEEVNDQHDTTYEYLRLRTSGTVTLTAPSRTGRWDVRLHDSDHNGREVASAAFEVRAVSGQLSLDETEYTSGGKMVVHYRVPGGAGSGAWAGVIPSSVEHGSEEVNDQHDLSYQYLDGPEGDLELEVPSAPGSYDVRLHDSDSNGSEIAHVSFTVVAPEGRVWLDKQTFVAGEPMTIRFAPATGLGSEAWISVVPSEIAHGSASTNDDNDVAYSYTDGRDGVVKLEAPTKPGSWDARLNDSTGSDGIEIAHASFTVELATAELRLEQTRFAPGAPITVHVEVSASLSDSAWAGIVPSSVAHGSESVNDDNDIAYRYLHGTTSGTLELSAPDEPGAYDIRLNDTDSNGNEIASVSFTVE